VKLGPLAPLLAALALAGCLGTLSIDPTPVVGPITPVPDRFKADHAPELVPSPVEGCQAAPSLDPNLFLLREGGALVPLRAEPLVHGVRLGRKLVSRERRRAAARACQDRRRTEKQAETAKSREERLEELERKLEELEESEPEQKTP